jgi:hypothetical protein
MTERQKLVRKIKKLKKAKEEDEENVEEELFETRALLNYVLVSFVESTSLKSGKY